MVCCMASLPDGRPRSKVQYPNGLFAFRILDGFIVFVLHAAAPNGAVGILDFGFRILDGFSLPPSCGGPKRGSLNFRFRNF